MHMPRTPWPDGVDELVVEALLRIVDDTLNVALDITDQRAEPDRVPVSYIVMIDADCGMQIRDKQFDDSSVITICNGHCGESAASPIRRLISARPRRRMSRAS